MYNKYVNILVLRTFSLQNPSFHMSIAWCVGDFEKELNIVLPQLNHKFSELIDDFGNDQWYIYVNSIFCKVGNKYYNFGLQW